MSSTNTSWAIWKEPGAETSLFLSGQVSQVDAGSFTGHGFLVHPFAGFKAFVIEGEARHWVHLPGKELTLPMFPAHVYPEDDRADYLCRLALLISKLQRQEAEKVVFSRRKHMVRGPFYLHEALTAFEAIAKAYPQAFVALVSLPSTGVWLTATPEVLCRQLGNSFYTMALAGTRSPGDSRPWGSKESREQALVTDFIRSQLSKLPVDNVAISGPKDSQAGNLRHLRTDFTFTSTITLLQAANALHPTPAVGAMPAEAGLPLIADLESSDRGMYAGYLGYLPKQAGDGATLYVCLRCACLSSPQPTLFAGGGILADSVAEEEWEETEQKLAVLLPLLQSI